jgi:hypothetical protein
VLDEVLAAPLLLTIRNRPRQRDFSVLDGDINVTGVQKGCIRESVADVFANPFVGALVSFRTPADERAFSPFTLPILVPRNVSRPVWAVGTRGRATPARVVPGVAAIATSAGFVISIAPAALIGITVERSCPTTLRSPPVIVGTIVATVQAIGLARALSLSLTGFALSGRFFFIEFGTKLRAHSRHNTSGRP